MMHSSRRAFLKQTAALSSAALVASPFGHLWAAEKPGAKMSLGLVTYLWGQDWDLPTVLANCEKAKILGVELRTQHKHGVEPSLTASQRREVRKRFEDSPVTFVGPGTNQRYDSPDAKDLQKNIEGTKAFIELSHDCGGTGVKVKPDSFQRNVPREKTIEQIGKALNEVGKFGANFGQRIRLEVHGSCAELPTIKAIMEVADHPNVGVCWNSNAEDLKGEGLEHNFNLVKGRMADTAHLRELNLSDDPYPYAQLIELYVKMNYAGWILLECRTKPADRIAALIEQREAFEKLVTQAQQKV